MGDLEIDSSTNPSPVFFPSVESENTPTLIKKTSLNNQIPDQMTSLADPNRKITGMELYAKSAAALTLGIIPFTVSKLGQLIVQGCAFIAQKAEGALHGFGLVGELLGKGLRMLIGIPAAISGAMLFGGAWVFSQTQKLAWGTYLVEHPQEEKSNTKLARFGAKEKLYNDFFQLVYAFYTSSKDVSYQRLSELRKFSVP